jgi:hypothetical protein
MPVASAVPGSITISGSVGSKDGPPSFPPASFNNPTDITTDGVNLYIVDKGNNKVRMIAPAGGATLANISAASAVISSITGAVDTQAVAGYADGSGSSATLDGPTGITTDGVSLYVTDSTNGTIRKIR